jgi:excisionase family DNA binding protein
MFLKLLAVLIQIAAYIRLIALSTKKVHTSEEAQAYLGISKAQAYLGISKDTLDKYAINNDLPFSRPKHMRYFDREELEKWALSNKVHSNQEIEEMALNHKSIRKSR